MILMVNKWMSLATSSSTSDASGEGLSLLRPPSRSTFIDLGHHTALGIWRGLGRAVEMKQSGRFLMQATISISTRAPTSAATTLQIVLNEVPYDRACQAWCRRLVRCCTLYVFVVHGWTTRTVTRGRRCTVPVTHTASSASARRNIR